MDLYTVEGLEEKYVSYVEPREECISSLVYTLKWRLSGRGTFVYTGK